MASIGESYEIIGKLLEGNGTYPGDPQAYSLNSYKNQWGGRTFQVSYSEMDNIGLFSSPFCADIRVLWTKANGLTEEGKKVLDAYKKEFPND